MAISDPVTAWKDDYVRLAEPSAELTHPAGLVQLSRESLQAVAGGAMSTHTEVCCHCTC